MDVQPYGWRIVDRPGKDFRRARSALSTDINILADVIGAEETPAADIKVQLRGPLSLAAGLHLHNGERALIDHGARRDLAASLAAGAGGYLSRVAAAAPGARIVVQIDEPEIASVLAGTIPTSSGYRTLRSVPGREATDAWQLVIDALRAAGAVEVVVSVPEVEAPFERILAAGADGIAVPLRALTSRQWEQLAGAVEAGKRLWAGALDVADPAAALPRVADVVETVWRPVAPAGPAGVDARRPAGHAVGRAGRAFAVVRDGGAGAADPGRRRPQPARARLAHGPALPRLSRLSCGLPSGPAGRGPEGTPGPTAPPGYGSSR